MTWYPNSIEEITHVVTKGTTPTTLGRQFTDSGVNFIKAEALNGDSGLDIGGFSHIDEDTHELLGRSVLREEDVLITIAGAQVGKCGYVKAEHLANTNQAVGIVRINKSRIGCMNMCGSGALLAMIYWRRRSEGERPEDMTRIRLNSPRFATPWPISWTSFTS